MKNQYKVLFVDDEPASLLITQGLINWGKFGLSVAATVNNGEEGLKYVNSHPVHAVVTDLQMPVMDGVTLIRYLRASGFSGPILALSNYSDFNLVRGALTAGAYDYLLKIDTTQEQMEKAARKMIEILEAQDSEGGISASADGQCLDPRFRDYIMDPNIELSADVDCSNFSFPLLACSFLLETDKVNEENIISFLCTAFSDVFKYHDNLDCIHIRNNEFLLFVPLGSNDYSMITRKLSILSRQIGLYFSSPSYICYSIDILSIPLIKKFYSLVAHGSILNFYENSAGVYRINLTDINEDYHFRREIMLSSVLSSLRSHDLNAALAFIREFSINCSDMMIHPVKVKNAFIILLWCCRDMDIIHADVNVIHDYSTRIEVATTITEVSNLLLSFFNAFNDFSDKASASTIHPEVAKALLFIHNNYSQKITLDDVAKHVGLSKEYFSRLFLKEMGVNLFRYILTVRMSKAAEMLSSGKPTLIKDVALAVGFDNQYFFSTKFKEYYGISPNLYKTGYEEEKNSDYINNTIQGEIL